MKFKILVIVLNIVLITFFLSIFILPFLLDNIDIKSFFSRYWFFAPLFLALCIGVNVVYVRNKGIITRAEDGDWVALCHSLESEVFDKQHTRFKNLKLLADVQLLLSDFSGLSRLETFVRSHCHEAIPKLATRFAGGKLLSGQYQELHSFTSNLVKSGKKDDFWLLFYVPFSLQMLKEYTKASDGFSDLLSYGRERIGYLISAMSGYFYYEVLKNKASVSAEKLVEQGKQFRESIKKTYSLSAWNAYCAKQKEEMYILVFKKVIDDTSAWLFS